MTGEATTDVYICADDMFSVSLQEVATGSCATDCMAFLKEIHDSEMCIVSFGAKYTYLKKKRQIPWNSVIFSEQLLGKQKRINISVFSRNEIMTQTYLGYSDIFRRDKNEPKCQCTCQCKTLKFPLRLLSHNRRLSVFLAFPSISILTC